MLSSIQNTASRLVYEASATALLVHVMAVHVASELRQVYGWVRYLAPVRS